VLAFSGYLASGSRDSTIRIWNAVENELKSTLLGHSGFVLALAALPNGDLLSDSKDGTIKLWSSANSIDFSISKILTSNTSVDRSSVIIGFNQALASPDSANNIRIYKL
jgi:WD40 repeat protein